MYCTVPPVESTLVFRPKPELSKNLIRSHFSLRRLARSIPVVLATGGLLGPALHSQTPAVGNTITWQQAAWGRRAPLAVTQGNQEGFALMPPQTTGVNFTNVLGDARAAENQIRLNGSGVALADVDGDGWCDVYLCGLENRNSLYRNLGNWRFEDITTKAGVGCEGQFSTGAVLADVDGDGDFDLLVNGVGTGTRLFLNDGKGQFTEGTDRGLVRRFCATTSSLGDVDGDGDLDLYVANYRTETVRSTGMTFLRIGEQRMVRPEDRDRLELTADGRVLEFGEPDVFYLNNGKGVFEPVPWTSGRFQQADGSPLDRNPFDWGLTVAFRDINGDGHPDLYVCNDFQTDDRIWINDGLGSFRPAPPLMFRHSPSFSMCVDFGDINRDGHFDLMVADMLSRSHPQRLMQLAGTAPYRAQPGVFEDRPQFDRNVVQLNNGDSTFVDVAPYAGLTKTEWNWESAFLDVDLDGYEDLLSTTSHLFDTQDLDAENYIRSKGPWPPERVSQRLLLFPRMVQPNQAFRNKGDLSFEDVGDRWGFNQVGVSHGMAFADLDNDGDLDVVVNNMNSAAGLYRTLSSAPRIAVRVKGTRSNTHGIGAKVSLIAELAAKPGEATAGAATARFVQSQEISAGGRYLSSDAPERVFATDVQTALLAKNPAATAGPITFRLEVLWRSGRRTTVHGVEPNYRYEVAEAAAEAVPGPPAPPRPLFREVSDRISHRHQDAPFNDFERQPLLPRKLSHGGPGLAWIDLDGDTHEDLVVGSGTGGRMAFFRGDGRGGFTALSKPGADTPVQRDQAGIVGVQKSTGSRVLVGASNYEDGFASGPLARVYEFPSGTARDSFPGQESSSGPLAMADVNGDGQMDLFVGGRVVPGKWPRSAASLLFIAQGERYVLDMTNTVEVAGAGLVSGATFADLNGDGWPDLLLACEWGPIRVFTNHQGHLREATAEMGLDRYVGWWNGVTVGDFDGDGRLDIAASNWGLNGGAAGYDRPVLAPAAAGPKTPGVPLLFWGEFERGIGMSVIEAEYDPGLNKVVPIRPKPAMETGFPFIAGKFPSFAAYNRASVEEVLEEEFQSASRLAATWLASTVFLSRSGKFQPVVLPQEAQFSPGYGICAADFDGDGNEDLFITQNFFHVQPEAVRCDAGRSVLLRGDGRGNFEFVPSMVSGLKVQGEGRGAATADFDGDGRVDLAAGQNSNTTLLYQNQGAKPGLRVRLSGGADNPAGVGAQVRLRFGKNWGPVREVQAGSGYWSQNSAVQVLATPQTPTEAWVRWPGGETNQVTIPTGQREILLNRSRQ